MPGLARYNDAHMSFDGPPASGSMAPVDKPSLVGQILDGRYRILKLIGEGGMGEVYAAEHIHIEKKYAVKLLKAEIVSNAEAVKRFQQEARSSSSIGHRNIIAIDDFNQLADGRIYMCMELLNGAALNDMLLQPMPVDRMLNILIQTGHGLAAAHAKNIIHRDMKPENIFVTIGPQGEDIPKILDFGIAKVSGNDGQNHLTRTGTIFGTPFYMAPEQALGNPVDARTDIYAMGVIMYEAFSGSLPFQGESFMGILTQHITSEPEPFAQRAARAGRNPPPGIAEIVTRAMQKNPAQRFQTMDELVNALVAIYRGIAGPGMSTYMAAVPHMSQPTPAPMTGVPQLNSYQQTIAASPSGSQPFLPAQAAQTGGAPLYDPSAHVVDVARKSKTGLIIAIVALLAVGGGITAVVLVGQSGKGGSGSAVATNDPRPGSGSTTPPDHDGSNGSGSATVPSTGSNGSGSATGPSTGSNGSGSATVPGTGSNGSGSATVPSDGSGSAGSAATPAALEILIETKPYVGAFAVVEAGKKLFDGPDNIDITPGTPRTVVIKRAGYKDKTVTIDGKTKKLVVSLERIPDSGHPNVLTNHPPPPGHPDCSKVVKDPHDKHCRAQYCDGHPSDPNCDLQD